MVDNKEYEITMFSELRKLAYDSQVGYSRWLLASMLLVHGGSLALIANMQTDRAATFVAGGGWFIGGIFATLLCGFFIWVNFDSAADAYHQASSAAINGRSPYDAMAPYNRILKVTRSGSIISGFASVGFFLAGSIFIYRLAMTPQPWWKTILALSSR